MIPTYWLLSAKKVIDNVENFMLKTMIGLEDKFGEDNLLESSRAWKIFNTKYFLVKTPWFHQQKELFREMEEEEFDYYKCSKEDWIKFFEHFLRKGKVLEYECHLSHSNHLIRLSELLASDKIKNGNEEAIQQAIESYSIIIDEQEMDYQALVLGYEVDNGNIIEFHVSTQLTITPGLFYHNNTDTVELDNMDNQSQTIISDILSFFSLTAKNEPLDLIEIQFLNEKEHPLKNAKEVIDYLFENINEETAKEKLGLNQIEWDIIKDNILRYGDKLKQI